MLRHCLSLVVASLPGLVGFSQFVSPARAEVTAKSGPRGVAIQIDGNPFTEYLTRSGAKPILWPVLGPTGQAMTRAYPMAQNPGEKKDHIHQRSLWFTHGDVNGVSFWDENAKHGTIVHRRFVAIEGGSEASLTTENDWIGPDNKQILADERRLKFGVEQDVRWIDFDITLKAAYGPVGLATPRKGHSACAWPNR